MAKKMKKGSKLQLRGYDNKGIIRTVTVEVLKKFDKGVYEVDVRTSSWYGWDWDSNRGTITRRNITNRLFVWMTEIEVVG